tara:strand:- start:249 stop:452 length:204 start_codon:yes stop_codon:yes gene_type:complete
LANGTIKKLTDRGFGFIKQESGKDIFFHCSFLENVEFEDLEEGDQVSYSIGQGEKGPRAEDIRVINP